MSLLVSYDINNLKQKSITDEQYLLQNKHDAENPKTFHDFPRVEKRRVKRSGYGNNCPPGYTGLYCESRM